MTRTGGRAALSASGKLEKDPIVAYAPLRDTLARSSEQLARLDALSKLQRPRRRRAHAPDDLGAEAGPACFDRELGQRLSARQSALNKLNTEYGRKAQAVLTAEQLTRFKESTAKRDN